MIIKLLLATIIFFYFLSVILIIRIFFRNHFRQHNKKIKIYYLKMLSKSVSNFSIGKGYIHAKLFLSALNTYRQSFRIAPEKLKIIAQTASDRGLLNQMIKRLSSFSRFKRRQAVGDLVNLQCTECQKALVKQFTKEKDTVTKFYIASALIQFEDRRLILLVISSLINAPIWYARKVSTILCQSTCTQLDCIIGKFLNSNDKNIQYFLVRYGSIHILPSLKKYLLKNIWSNDKDLAIQACKGISLLYPDTLQNKLFLNHPDEAVRNIIIETLSKFPSQENIKKISTFLTSTNSKKINLQNAETAVHAISNMIQQTPELIPELVQSFHKSKGIMKNFYSRILAFRFDYFAMRICTTEKKEALVIIREILESGCHAECLDFLNRNTNHLIENELIPLIKELFNKQAGFCNDFQIYAKDSLLKQLNLKRKNNSSKIPERKWEKRRSKTLIAGIFSLMAVLLISFLSIHHKNFYSWTYLQCLRSFVVDYNHLLILYTFALNLMFFLLIFMSFFGIKRQDKMWKLKKRTDLFCSGLLPSITIIAPAFQEEKNIVQSIRGLLTLQYPDYEIIVVNDGSTDTTLLQLIKAFDLEKIDLQPQRFLKIKKIRGIYRSLRYSYLTVIDKENGGKADTLNAGLNYSTKEYFCGIDADSLLETDALLKIASASLDHSSFFAASGGNIIPINGCTITNGMLQKIAIPKHPLEQLQMIEYIRAFIIGRVGWSEINSLLIISGAFGLFYTKDVCKIGGYLTSSERFGKDSVGEDMELVMRLRRHLSEIHKKFRINYVFNAYCWTEVPETLKVLYQQRDRWHRGLIENIYFHRKLIFNYSYGLMGLLAMPYFLIFEIIGPFIEVLGYPMIIAAFLLGVMNAEIALALFLTSVVMGCFISITSLFLFGQQRDIFSIRSQLYLIFIAFIENFGFRQFISSWRIIGYINTIKRPKGWGIMKRKGF